MAEPKIKAKRPMTPAAFRRLVRRWRGRFQGGGALKVLAEERARDREREEAKFLASHK